MDEFQSWEEQRQFIIDQLYAESFRGFTRYELEEWVDQHVTSPPNTNPKGTQAWVDEKLRLDRLSKSGGTGATQTPGQTSYVDPGAAGAGGDDVPVPVDWESFLTGQGLYEGPSGFTEETHTPAIVDPDTMDRIVAGVRAWDGSTRGSSADLIPTAGYDHEGDPADPDMTNWATLVDNINAMPMAEKGMLLDQIFEPELESYVALRTPGGQRVVIPTVAYDKVETYVAGAGMGRLDVNAAIFAGADAGVPWELVLFARTATAGPDDTAVGTVLGPGGRERIDIPFVTVADSVRQGMGLYQGDTTFALLHAVDPVLAERIWDHPFNLTVDEVTKKDQIVKPLFNYTLEQRGIMLPHNREVLAEVMNLTSELPPEPIFERTAPGDLEEAYRTQYRALFQADPTEEQLANFIEHFNREFDVYEQEVRAGQLKTSWQKGSTEGWYALDDEGNYTLREPPRQPTAPSEFHEMMSTLRADDLYTSRYGNKPAGMEEDAYANVFQQQARDLLGPEADLRPELAQAGMATGDPRTVGIQVGLSGAGYGSSKFMERLHRGANVIRQWT